MPGRAGLEAEEAAADLGLFLAGDDELGLEPTEGRGLTFALAADLEGPLDVLLVDEELVLVEADVEAEGHGAFPGAGGQQEGAVSLQYSVSETCVATIPGASLAVGRPPGRPRGQWTPAP